MDYRNSNVLYILTSKRGLVVNVGANLDGDFSTKTSRKRRARLDSLSKVKHVQEYIAFIFVAEHYKMVNPDPAPRGAFRGRAPPNDCLCPTKRKLCPPSEDCAPKKLTGPGLLECKLGPKLVFFTRIFVIFAIKTLFFFGGHLFSAGARRILLARQCKYCIQFLTDDPAILDFISYKILPLHNITMTTDFLFLLKTAILFILCRQKQFVYNLKISH